jgi:ADP-ribosylglycohydrolase
VSARTARDRARGALWGLAVGDALGMPAEGLPRAVVAQRYGLIDRFHPGLAEDNEIAGNLPAGHVTDDTDQAVIIGRLLVDGAGRVDATELADRLLAWQESMREAGAASLLGPSTLRALQHISTHGPSPTSGRWGDTNGAAMRIAPVGVATPARPLQVLVDRVVAVSEPTHNTHVALAGAAAVAAAVAVAVDGAGLPEVLDAATAAARSAATRGFYTAAPSLAGRLECAVRLTLEAVEVVGTSLITQESVPAAFAALALADAVRPGGAADPWWVCRIAASLGGDCDTIAAMAGAVAGAMGGRQALPAAAVEAVARVNPTLDLDTLADDLLELRR